MLIVPMPTWTAVGAHRYYLEEEQIYVELHGDLGAAELRVMWDVAEQIEDTYGYAISVFDARHSNGVSTDGRKYVGERNRKRALLGPVVMIGANIVVRTVARLLNQATLLIGKKPSPVFFCNTVEEVPAIVAEQRRAYARLKKRPT
jgi:hypothetical protein